MLRRAEQRDDRALGINRLAVFLQQQSSMRAPDRLIDPVIDGVSMQNPFGLGEYILARQAGRGRDDAGNGGLAAGCRAADCARGGRIAGAGCGACAACSACRASAASRSRSIFGLKHRGIARQSGQAPTRELRRNNCDCFPSLIPDVPA
jgi:hypothetical protein